MTAESAKPPLVLLILDGWGHREARQDNAIANAKTPVWDKLWQQAPHTLIATSGKDVGLPSGQMGNSEVGHMSLGAGRVVYQNMTRIDKAIEDGDFFQNPAYQSAIDKAVSSGKAVHIMGLLSPGGVHSHESHLCAMVEMAAQRGATQVYAHAFLDGRDTPPRSAKASIDLLEHKLTSTGVGRIASIVGRFYAMDRDKRWDRIEQAYRMLTEGVAPYRFADPVSALEAAYERDENDEFVKPTCIQIDQEPVVISDGDAVIFMNFRADRGRELTRTFVDADFIEFNRKVVPRLADFVMTTQYAADIDTPVAFPPKPLNNVLGEYLQDLGKTQLRIAETEKYAHVTFFFSGGREEAFTGEDRILIPSPKVDTYDMQPEMSAAEVTDKLIEAIKSQRYDVIICNFANGDMVGHTGIYQAAIKAAQCIDQSLKRIIEALREVDGQALITADHGNCELMLDYENGQPHTQHTTGTVPLVYVGPRDINFMIKDGRLSDIAPTLLKLLGLEQPCEMDGRPLIEQL